MLLLQFKGQNVLVPRQVSTDYGFNDEVCNCYEGQLQIIETEASSQTTDIDTSVQHIDAYNPKPSKIGQLFVGPKTLLRRLWSRQDSLESCDNSSSTDSLHSSDNDECTTTEDKSKDIIEVPEEFQVREFPASSLFSTSSASSRTEVRMHLRQCTAHTSVTSAESRDDRFYHVFKKGEIEKLVKNNTQGLRVVNCIYRSGHWCATLRKTI